MISEVNMLDMDGAWWIDSGATKHVCKDRGSFKKFEPVKETIYMGNSASTQVLGKCSVDLVLTSGITLTLNELLYVPEI